MAHPRDRHAVPLIKRLLELKQHQHPIDVALHPSQPKRPPRPQLRADVVDHAAAGALGQGGDDGQVEIAKVDEQHKVRPIGGQALLEQSAHVEEMAEVTRRIDGPDTFTFVDQKIYDARQAVYDGKYDLAIRRTQDVLDLEPNNITALEIMGSSFFLMEEKSKAKAVWKKVLELDPQNRTVGEFLRQVP